MKIVIKSEMKRFRIFLLLVSLLLLLVVYPYCYFLDDMNLRTYVALSISSICVIIVQLKLVK